MDNSEIETGWVSINKKGEELCGDHVEVIKNPDGTFVMVLADGLGSGVKANILSTLTSSMLSTMIEGGLSLQDSVDSLIRTLPVAKDRGNVAYSTFTIMKTTPDYLVSIYNYDNPEPILLHEGKEKKIDWRMVELQGKKIYSGLVQLGVGDTLIYMSDGAVYAGVGESLNFGWTRDEIVKYMEGLYSESISSKNLATLLIDHCNVLYNNHPGDDTTACVLRRRKRVNANWMVGPATNPDDDPKMMSLFFNRPGLHIVSGGTSAKVASKYLCQRIDTSLDYIDPEIPPISHIKGVDLVSEGVITLNKLLEVAKDYLGNNKDYFDWSYKQDGVSLLAKLLFEEATDINIFVGCAVNPAHQDPRYNISISTKMGLVEEITKLLKSMNKHIHVAYF
ncbi:MAG: serine/threonine-protein phosphatase [Bacilli bacterium]|nr:serine/threonine-protein phosphatase [Bacilli bacterium]MCH4210348.1 serine/threonine-protein phosphatase [Bacilli bacterium]MCH4228882.1 serine/threonine-protein phosphatase [Bacilli bacterium]MCH4277974.1 serine/threonine-protein phosphatase [Bacilli bacterium]MCI2054762.1 serine/threonine-protein phosphatase [Bacilli bacterium]